MRIASYYKTLDVTQSKLGGVGQGGGGYWETAVGYSLQQEIAKQLSAYVAFNPRPHGKDSFDVAHYDVVDDDFDIAYCQLFDLPSTRPARWVYSIISDYIGMEKVLEDWLAAAKPDVLISLQYPVNDDHQPNLWQQCARHGCTPIFLPWFNATNFPVAVTQEQRNVVGMSSGAMGGTYPNRQAIYNYLTGLGRDDIVLSGNAAGGGNYRLSDAEYQDALHRCRYYFSGGIYDIQIPPKYYEIMNYGATLVSHELMNMEQAGFIDGVTYIKLNNLDEIPAILESDRWQQIGREGQRMVHERHSMTQRATDIIRVYNEAKI